MLIFVITYKEQRMDIAPLASWPIQIDHPIIIAGPCSAETPEQVMQTALELGKSTKVNLFRSGIWKPRTRPGSFQGIGEPALEWLVEAGKASGIPTTTEVANAQHVEACLKAGVDVLWIGARTTVNPFSVQEIADALKGVDIPVIIKNPINPDLQLWIGAVERFLNNGLNKLMVMHRGFSSPNPGIYRNAPMWEIPIELKALHPDLPIICDPSHITGKRELLLDVAQKAMDLGMHGLMIETHPTPEKAWSDARQQVTPERFVELVDHLQLRTENVDQTSSAHLSGLRARIDDIDTHIIQLLKDRMELITEIGEYKKDHGLTILQLERWKEILETRSALAKKLGLQEDFVRRYLETVHKASIKEQSRIMNEGQEDQVMWS
ncbi:MAG: bifunctional 3-deoxy-7-phosphoheptulonate synthase/chorismate mutase type II [Flavobacteriales bacterium]|nr:bifunctional 3-deoxy-7-phosphoheptulonate synthase/chorismate mutase type II [Flavobacteriales bacterium]